MIVIIIVMIIMIMIVTILIYDYYNDDSCMIVIMQIDNHNGDYYDRNYNKNDDTAKQISVQSSVLIFKQDKISFFFFFFNLICRPTPCHLPICCQLLNYRIFDIITGELIPYRLKHLSERLRFHISKIFLILFHSHVTGDKEVA